MAPVRRWLMQVRILAPLELPDFRVLWVGMVASLLGDGIFLVALAWQVYTMSNTPSALAVVGIAITLPQVLLLLLGGVASDRYDRRKVMIAADVVRGLAIGAIGILTVWGALTLPAMVALMIVYGAATAFFGPAFDAIVPRIVPSDRLTEANALDQFMRPAAVRLAGPALGGLVVATIGSGSAFLLDAATFAVSAVCVARIAPAAHVPAGDDGELSIRAAWKGLQFVRAHVWLWGTFMGATISYLLFMGPSEVLLPYVVKNVMHEGAGALGLIFGAGGIGALLAAIVTGQRGMPHSHITLMYITWAGATLAVAGYGLAMWEWQLAVACFMFNALEAAGTVWWATTKGRLVPPSLLGRVSSFDWFISTALVPLSYALTAPLVAEIGARGTLIAVGVAGAVTTIAPLFLRGMRDLERSGLARDPGDRFAPAAREVQAT